MIARRVLPGFSVGLREAIADPAAAVESNRILNESSRAPSQRVGVDVRTVTRAQYYKLHLQILECGVPTVTVLYCSFDIAALSA